MEEDSYKSLGSLSSLGNYDKDYIEDKQFTQHI